MGSNRREVFGLIVIVVMFMVMLSGEATECRSAIVSLSPCVNYVCGNASTPSFSCCSQLADVVKSQPRCLCALISGGHGHSSMGFKINQTLALGLPAACSVHTPPVSRCDGTQWRGAQCFVLQNRSKGYPVEVHSPILFVDGNGTQAVPPVPAKSEGTTINLPFYFSFATLLVALNMYV